MNKILPILLVFGFMVSSQVQAYRYQNYDNQSRSHQMNHISVDGQFSNQYSPSAQRPPSESEKLRQKRAQLEQQNERMIQERMEQIRYEKELILMRQMQEAMNQTLQSIGNIGQ